MPLSRGSSMCSKGSNDLDASCMILTFGLVHSCRTIPLLRSKTQDHVALSVSS